MANRWLLPFIAADGTLTVTVAVKNTGSIAGKRLAAQLYVEAMINAVCFTCKGAETFCKVSSGTGRGRKSVTFRLTPDG